MSWFDPYARAENSQNEIVGEFNILIALLFCSLDPSKITYATRGPEMAQKLINTKVVNKFVVSENKVDKPYEILKRIKFKYSNEFSEFMSKLSTSVLLFTKANNSLVIYLFDKNKFKPMLFQSDKVTRVSDLGSDVLVFFELGSAGKSDMQLVRTDVNKLYEAIIKKIDDDDDSSPSGTVKKNSKLIIIITTVAAGGILLSTQQEEKFAKAKKTTNNKTKTNKLMEIIKKPEEIQPITIESMQTEPKAESMQTE